MPSFYQVAQGQGHDLMRIHKITALIHGANAISISICDQTEIAHSGTNGTRQRFKIPGNRLRMYSAKTRVHFTADFLNLATGTLQNAADDTSPGTIHRVDHKALRVLGNQIKIDQFAQMIVVGRDWIELADQVKFASLFEIHNIGAACL